MTDKLVPLSAVLAALEKELPCWRLTTPNIFVKGKPPQNDGKTCEDILKLGDNLGMCPNCRARKAVMEALER